MNDSICRSKNIPILKNPCLTLEKRHHPPKDKFIHQTEIDLLAPYF
ncbi:hypothetical protein TFKS16_2854 [Tannerella forsythia KS16]|uniref:Uncharacterized protein n=1 Tax=Tannerella forsythia (strain ATCC 43037 / JCM 10827 / CCUG 21028 A / KCTC 5666 / FDC 338) TaxID=203275 RepID=G8UR23_TANFA|nr:hypothetical protein BFO_3152 [Tannerella forsythia 92A2]BAR50183.1 hypothetical protein TF3313_2766 [Tannerella forsythia 3313]BAR53024.1 hypothetical protein TFKS16_2854 [Tannerella forsythia KS16]